MLATEQGSDSVSVNFHFLETHWGSFVINELHLTRMYIVLYFVLLPVHAVLRCSSWWSLI